MDFAFPICTKMRNKGISEIRYSFEELKNLSNYKPTSNKRFINDLDKTYTKMLSLNYKIGDSKNFERFVLFTGFKVDSDGNYYQNDLFHLIQEEENKTFPSIGLK